MTEIALSRRLFIALVSLLIATLAFHGAVASALVTRGDDALRSGDEKSAFMYYRRAMIFEPTVTTAADRLAFHLALHHSRVDAKRAIVIANGGLHRNPQDGSLLADRALAEERLKAWSTAERDFTRAADILHDARYDQFAGKAALQRGDRSAARQHFNHALHLDPSFAPARVALKASR